MFFKLLNAQELKDHKEKTKKLKKQVFELTQNSIVVKLREDLELSNSRAEHFEQEYFNLKKSHETLTDCYRTISEADQQLKADLYDLTKQVRDKDAEIKELKSSEYFSVRGNLKVDTSLLSDDQINELSKPE